MAFNISIHLYYPRKLQWILKFQKANLFFLFFLIINENLLDTVPTLKKVKSRGQKIFNFGSLVLAEIADIDAMKKTDNYCCITSKEKKMRGLVLITKPKNKDISWYNEMCAKLGSVREWGTVTNLKKIFRKCRNTGQI